MVPAAPLPSTLLLACLLSAAGGARALRPGVATPRRTQPLPSTADCETHWIEQRLDHFSFASPANATFKQRYFVCDPPGAPTSFVPKAIFFYCGNEANVELYVNATGLMWEHALAREAVLVFAEHRFYGQSLPHAPASSGSGKKNAFLSHELALADYATLLAQLRRSMRGPQKTVEAAEAPLLPAVAFGGSYGGKLAAWLRMKFPSSVIGAVAASAPLLAFRGESTDSTGESDDWNSGSYYAVITNTAKFYSNFCAGNIAAGIESVGKVGATAAGRMRLQTEFGLCAEPKNDYEVSMLRYFLRDAFDELAMANYPFESDYIGGNAAHPLPRYPFGQSCQPLMHDLTNPKDAAKLFPALRKAVAVLYNATFDVGCYTLPVYPTSVDPSQPMDGLWDWQWCTEQMPDSYWFSTFGGSRDMFWSNPYNQTLVNAHCREAWGVEPRTCDACPLPACSRASIFNH